MSDSDNPPPSPREEDAGTPREVLVVSFQTDTRYGDDPGGLVHFPVRAARVTKQAEALGGKLCAFGPLAFSFAFPGDDLEDPIAWAAEVAIKEGAVPKLSVGISHGELASIVEPQALLAIGWGRALVVASALAASAHLGEILVDPEIPDVMQTVRATGRRWVSGGGAAIAALSLDATQPLLSASGSIFIEPDDVFGAKALAMVSPLHAALEPGLDTAGIATAADHARQALLRGDLESLDAALAELKPTGAHPELVERLAGLLALTRGAKDEGLRMLRQAVDSETRPRFKTRAHLAYAIALASAGRPEAALLEALTALARAREMLDVAGEAATARFLSQLSTSTGHSAAASVWEHVVEGASGQGG